MNVRINSEQQRLLQALQSGCYLKVHRTLDGAKLYQLHGAHAGGEHSNDKGAEIVSPGLVETLERHGYLQSNMKFPAAMLLLTERGIEAANAASSLRPIGPRRY